MSNYPPGVSAADFNGPTYYGLQVLNVNACKNYDTPVAPGEGFQTEDDKANGEQYACIFEGGDVEGELEGAWFDWYCPVCDAINETEIDIDDYREGMHDY